MSQGMSAEQETSGLRPQHAPALPSAALPPAMASMQERSADDILREMNRVPLFMTALDESDGEGGENVELEALKALAYEGTRAEVAENFRQQGNELARAKMWADAKEFYNKAIAAFKAPLKPQDAEEGPADMDVVEVDEEAEREKELHIEEACFINRALCNLEKKNYRSCIQDCASTLRLNQSNVKAFYRSASACLALDKLPEAADACNRGLAIDASNVPLKSLAAKINARKESLESIARIRREREERRRAEESALKMALKSRKIITRTSDQAPEMEDAAMRLENPLDPTSALSIPVILLYPLHAQSDFVKAFQETETLTDHLEYILPLPWDESRDYTVSGVECYMETIAGGLIKAGKKVAMGKILGSGKYEVLDRLVKVNVLPKDKASGWIEEFKKRKSK